MDDLDKSSPMAILKFGCIKVNPLTGRGRKIYLMQLVLLPLLPIFALIVENLYQLHTQTELKLTIEEDSIQINSIETYSNVIHVLQNERNETANYFQQLHNKSTIQIIFNWTNEELKNITVDHENIINNELSNTSQNNSTNLYNTYLYSYTVLNTKYINLILEKILLTSDGKFWRKLMGYKSLIDVIENLWLKMYFGMQFYFSNGNQTERLFAYSKFIHYNTKVIKYLNVTKGYLIEKNYLNALNVVDGDHDHDEEDNANKWYEKLMNGGTLTTHSNVTKIIIGKHYFYQNFNITDHLWEFQKRLMCELKNNINEHILRAKLQQTTTFSLLILALVLSPLVIFLIKNATSTIQNFAQKLITCTQQLRTEQRKSDLLLCQMLPIQVVKQLKQQKQVPAENFDAVTIFFSDVVGFTKLSAYSTAMEVITLLNTLYKLFDSRILKYDVYKVETIGDAYMVASGLPQRNGNNHAKEIGLMSLDLLIGIKGFYIPHRPNENLQIRVGINTGPCVAGVIGTTMPRYCLFGDTINTASRMESTGESMKIQISNSTKEALDQIGGFRIAIRGNMNIKGKGSMNTYWLLGHKLMDDKIEKDLNQHIQEIVTEPEFIQMIERF